MGKILFEVAKYFRSIQTPTPTNRHVELIHASASTYQLYFPSIGCRYNCTMCNYGLGHPICPKTVLKELDNLVFPKEIKSLVLESSGSFLDEREIPSWLQIEIMKHISQTKISTIIIETHYTTVTAEKLQTISDIFSPYGKDVEIELGFESASKEVLEIYNKKIILEELAKTVWRAAKHGISTELNLLSGAPLLSTEEQIDDTISSIEWVIQHCPKSTSMVLFPINIKSRTLLMHMYEKGRYSPVSHWDFIEVLNRIPIEYLDRISVAWYGNMVNVYDGPDAIIHPKSCIKCLDKIQNFYRKFLTTYSNAGKRKLLDEILESHCDCHSPFNQQPTLPIRERIAIEEQLLAKELSIGK